MSRLFAEYLMDTRNILDVDRDKLCDVLCSGEIYGRYLKTLQSFEFKVLDVYSYFGTGGSDIYFYFVRIPEEDLLRMLKIDSYSDDEKNELYYHRMLGFESGGTGLEQGELADDVYWGISVLQYFFHISKRTIKDMKTAEHLFKLHRVPDKKVFLKRRVLHSKGGRPLGVANSLSSADRQNLENADVIIRTCVEKDRYWEYMELSKLLVRVRRISSLTAAKWKFYILRYQYKVACGLCTRDLEYEKELIAKNLKYRIFEQELTF